MAREVEQPEVLHASDTVETPQDDNSTVVREARPAAVPASSAATDEESAPATYGERQVILHGRHGGLHLWTDFLGFAVAVFFLTVFLGIVGAIVGEVGYQLHAPVPKIGGSIPNQSVNLGIGALIGTLVAVFLAYLLGGYAAGRMARFDGVRNGLGVWLWTIIVAVLLGIAGAIIGTTFNVASQIHLKIDTATLTMAGAISIAVTLIVMLLGAVLGGLFGERYNRRIDREGEAL